MMTSTDLAARMDHTLLAPEATPDRVDALCEEALRFGFAGVCVNPVFVRRAAAQMERLTRDAGGDRRPAVISVAGFPLGASTTATKADEARRGMDDGATEIDMVIHVGSLVAGDAAGVRRDIAAVARAVHGRTPGGLLKVILETRALTDAQIILGCRCCAEGEADFVKTSTGLHPAGGATVEHVRLLHRHAAPMRVKASGGIRTAAAALALVEAGAARIGTSSGLAIMNELRQRSG
jgi:deoxyribose-phosphate aldolase